ncbi:MAG: response regulator [Deltaproteobacteria bacterium]|nr:response regulator [Deltaproteobacteria bacterium]
MSTRLLLVDDEAAIRFAVADYFEQNGFHVDAAADRESAQRLLGVSDYDVAIVDLRLTGAECREGLNLVRHIRANATRTPVVLLTGSDSAELLAAAEDCGVAAVLFKSTSLARVGAVVAGLLRR